MIPLLGARGASDFQVALISDTLRKANALRGRITRYLFLGGRDSPGFTLPAKYTVVRQRGVDLGERLHAAFQHLLRRHTRAVVIGTDSPRLLTRTLRQALCELTICEAVLGPCPDGGYYLIGLRRLEVAARGGLFRGVRWGSAFAFRDTLRNLLRRNSSCSILRPLADIDRPEDLRPLRKELASSPSSRRLAPAVWQFLKYRSL